MNLKDMLAAKQRALQTAAQERDTALAAQTKILDTATAAGRSALSEDEDREVRAASEQKRSASERVASLTTEVSDLEKEIREDEEYAKRTESTRDSGARPAYDEVGRVTSEERTYSAHKERGFVREDKGTAVFRAGVKPGAGFELDVINAFRGDYEAQDRLRRHQAEERAERGQYMQRAVGTAAFAGLTVPQYLTDLYAPAAAAGRPFADACRKHVLPASGMTVDISQITTATSNAIQTQNVASSETNIDDTLLAIGVLTAAGQQTVSRQAIERGTNVEPIVLDDLFRRNATVLDNTLVNQTTNGLTNVANSVAYTDASPTAAELYPKILNGLANVEAALLDQSSGENIAVMHSRRWYWMQSQVGSTFPFIGQPGFTEYQGGVNLATRYGSGVRGVLPNGTPVIVDNNIATNLGGGTEDEIYLGDRMEFHLWEDPNAPLFIRAEQTSAASLGVLLVVYSYFAFTHARQAHSQKIAGTGLAAPTF